MYIAVAISFPSLGLIMFVFFYVRTSTKLSHSSPLYTHMAVQVLSALRNLEFPLKFEDNLPNVAKIVKLLLAENPAERPPADELTKNTSLQNLSKKMRKNKDDFILKF